MTTTPGAGQGGGTDRPGAAAGEARDALREDARRLSDEARTRAENLSHEARDRAETARQGAGEEVGHTSEALSRAADELEPGSVSAQLLRQASDGLAEIARTVQGRDLGDMAGEVADFGRRNPVAFLGAAALAGFAIGRFATARAPHAGGYAPATRRSGAYRPETHAPGTRGAGTQGTDESARTVAPTPPQGTGTGPVQPPTSPGAGMASPGSPAGTPPQKGTRP